MGFIKYEQLYWKLPRINDGVENTFFRIFGSNVLTREYASVEKETQNG